MSENKYPSFTRPVILDNTKEARDKYGYAYGADTVLLTDAEIAALQNGKCLAFTDGEYNHFIIIEKHVTP